MSRVAVRLPISSLFARERLWGLARDFTWINLAVLAGNLASYGYQLGMSRTLTVADYGLWNALLAIAILLQIPMWTINMMVARRVAQLAAQGAGGEIQDYLLEMLRGVSRLIVVGVLLYALLIPVLLSALDVRSPVPLLLIAVVGATGLLFPFGIGTLQGFQRFGVVGWATFIQRCGIFAGLALVTAGAGVSGAIAGLVIGNICGILFSFGMSRLELSRRNSVSEVRRERFDNGSDRTWPVVATYAILTMLLYMDMLLARYYLDPDVAGRYATVSMLGKAIYYGSFAVLILLVPKVASAHAAGRDTAPYLHLGLAITALLVAPAACLFLLFPSQAISILFGNKYAGDSMATFARVYIVAAIFLTLVATASHYYLAKQAHSFLWAIVAAPALSLLMVIFRHDTPTDVAWAMVIGSGSALAGLCLVQAPWRRIPYWYSLSTSPALRSMGTFVRTKLPRIPSFSEPTARGTTEDSHRRG
ncbi:MAG: oligosaccharide flippase family protein [Dehalococcoidia bacterium]|nr:oligosaccharide flippase family protein [Dehalococcoidia bacterium]